MFGGVDLPKFEFPEDEKLRLKVGLDLTHIARDVRSAWNAAMTRGFNTRLQPVDGETPAAKARRIARTARNSFPAWFIKNFEKATLVLEGTSTFGAKVAVNVSGASRSDWSATIARTPIRSRHKAIAGMSTAAISMGFPNWQTISGLQSDEVATLVDAISFIANRDRKIDACLHISTKESGAYAVLVMSTADPNTDAGMISRTLATGQLGNTTCKATKKEVFILINVEAEDPRVNDLISDYSSRGKARADLIHVDIDGTHVVALAGVASQLLGDRQRLLPSRTRMFALTQALREREREDRLQLRITAKGETVVGKGHVTRGFAQSTVLLAGALYEEKERRLSETMRVKGLAPGK